MPRFDSGNVPAAYTQPRRKFRLCESLYPARHPYTRTDVPAMDHLLPYQGHRRWPRPARHRGPR
jgi:hypothetical protein